MKKLFLASLFKETASLFADFAGEDLQRRTIAFIPTAGIPEKLGLHARCSKRLLAKMGFVVNELDVSTAPPAEAEEKLKRCDCVYVSGGNTFFLLQELNRAGVTELLKDQIEAGKPFVGESAGAILAAPGIGYSKAMDDPAAAPLLTTCEGLGVVDFYPVPHCKDRPLRKAAEAIMAEYAANLPLVPISNKQAILVNGDETTVVP